MILLYSLTINIVWFFIGLFVGGIGGFILAALMNASRRGDDISDDIARMRYDNHDI